MFLRRMLIPRRFTSAMPQNQNRQTTSTMTTTARPVDDNTNLTPTPIDQNETRGLLAKGRNRLLQRGYHGPSDCVRDTEDQQHRPDAISGDMEYPQGAELALITLALCLAVLCMALDNTIISTAVPKITDNFHAFDDVGWYGSAYLTTLCAFQLFYGKLYTLFNTKLVFLLSMLLFEAGSAVCGAAPNSPSLILGRAVAGIGSAGIFSGAILIISHVVPLRKRSLFMSIVGGMCGVASVAGPLIGGALAEHVTWRWCFYINLPIGAMASLAILGFYHIATPASTIGLSVRGRISQLDPMESTVFVAMIICLLLPLQWGGSKYSWHDGRVIAPLAVFGLLLVFAGFHAWLKDNAAISLRLLQQRSVAACAWFNFMLGTAFFIVVYYLPIWFQAIQGVSELGSGLRLIPSLFSQIIFSLISGAAVAALGYYLPFVIGASVALAIGAGLLSTYSLHMKIGAMIIYQIVFGAGLGLGMQNTLVAIQTVLSSEDVPTGTAILISAQMLGGAIGLSVSQNVFQSRLLELRTKIPSLDHSSVMNSGVTELLDRVPTEFRGLVQDRYQDAFTSTLYIAAAAGVASVLGSLLIERRSVLHSVQSPQEGPDG